MRPRRHPVGDLGERVGVLVEHRGERRAHVAGRDAVDAHRRSVLERAALRQRDHARLGRRVRGLVAGRRDARHRRVVDDRTAAALEHERHRRPHRVVRAGEVHVDEAMPELLVERVQRPEVAEARRCSRARGAHRAARRSRSNAVVDAVRRRARRVAYAWPSISAATASPASASRSMMATTAPSFANAVAVALPDPRTAAGDDGDLAFELGARNFRHERSR